jgi:hypothetical protein
VIFLEILHASSHLPTPDDLQHILAKIVLIDDQFIAVAMCTFLDLVDLIQLEVVACASSPISVICLAPSRQDPPEEPTALDTVPNVSKRRTSLDAAHCNAKLYRPATTKPVEWCLW